MTDEVKVDNELFFAVIIIALGFVGYKFYRETDFKTAFHNAIPYLLLALFILLIMAWFVLHVMYKVENLKRYYIASNIIKNIIIAVIIIAFLYRTYLILKNITFELSYTIHLIIVLMILLYYNYCAHKDWFTHKENRRIAIEKFNKEHNELIVFLQYNEDDIQKLEQTLSTIKNKVFKPEIISGYEVALKNKIAELTKHLEDLKQEYKIRSLEEREQLLIKSIKDKEKQHLEVSMDEGQRLAGLKYDLLHSDKTVFTKRELSKEKIRLLKEGGYKQVNEYCIYEKKLITVLVKPVLNHSATHVFLVWSMMKFLKDFDIKNLEEHETRDADITFTYKHKKYAIEIETGNLLKKKKQLEDKVLFLKRKYQDRWFFIVSNKNLQPSYRKYGLATQRKGVEKMLEKVLKISTR